MQKDKIYSFVSVKLKLSKKAANAWKSEKKNDSFFVVAVHIFK